MRAVGDGRFWFLFILGKTCLVRGRSGIGPDDPTPDL